MWFGEKEGAEKLLERVGEWNLEGFEKVKMVKGLGVGCSKVGVEGMGVVLDWVSFFFFFFFFFLHVFFNEFTLTILSLSLIGQKK